VNVQGNPYFRNPSTNITYRSWSRERPSVETVDRNEACESFRQTFQLHF